ncbi:MAG: helix-turn-helix transcriptional regulator [Bacteroides sp.]|nr:helix-turn-helix transcriptional regulator [Bacteroides sp.]
MEILQEQNHTKYWLYKQMDMSYQNFNRIVNNETTAIQFDKLEEISDLLGCSVGDLFEKVDVPDDEDK